MNFHDNKIRCYLPEDSGHCYLTLTPEEWRKLRRAKRLDDTLRAARDKARGKDTPDYSCPEERRQAEEWEMEQRMLLRQVDAQIAYDNGDDIDDGLEDWEK